MVNLEEPIAQFERDGYLVLHDFFDPEPMDRIDHTIHQHFGTDPEFRHEEDFLSRSETEVIPWFPQNPDLPEYDAVRATPFDRLEADPRLGELTEALLGDGWSPLYSMVMFSKKGTKGQAWHQDCPPDDPARYNLNRLVYTRDLSDDVGGWCCFTAIPGTGFCRSPAPSAFRPITGPAPAARRRTSPTSVSTATCVTILPRTA